MVTRSEITRSRRIQKLTKFIIALLNKSSITSEEIEEESDEFIRREFGVARSTAIDYRETAFALARKALSFKEDREIPSKGVVV